MATVLFPPKNWMPSPVSDYLALVCRAPPSWYSTCFLFAVALNPGCTLESNGHFKKMSVWALMRDSYLIGLWWSLALGVLIVLLIWYKRHVLYSLTDLDLQVLWFWTNEYFLSPFLHLRKRDKMTHFLRLLESHGDSATCTNQLIAWHTLN